MVRSVRQMGTRATAVVVMLAMAASGCSSTTSSGVSSASSTESAPAITVSESSTTEQPAAGATTAAALSDVDVEIVDAVAPISSTSALTLTRDQVQFMGAEAAAHGGLRGDVLDAAGGGAPSGVPMSAVLAGYVRGVQTPAAEFARSVMAGQDLTRPDGAVFPSVVLVLFAADAAKAFSTDPATASGLRRSSLSNTAFPSSRRSGTICSDVTKSIFDAVEGIFAKIHIPPGKVGDTGSSFLNGVLQGLTDVVVGSLNFVIDAARTLVVNGIKYLLDQVLSVVAEVAAAAALIGNFVSAVRPWKLELAPEASDTSKGIEPNKVYDSVTAKAILIGPTDDWPEWFVDCSKTAGVTLPSLLPVDAGIGWKVSALSADLMKESDDQVPKETKLHKDPSGGVIAKLGLVTGMETKAQAETGQPQQGNVSITATARRDQIADLRKTLVDAANDLAGRVLQIVPAVIRNFLLKLVAEAADSSSDQVASLLDASTVAIISVGYHGPPEPLGTAPSSSGPKSSSDYCALFIDFANWSLANLEAVTAEASEPTFTVRDAFFTEYLVRMAAMQEVEPVELHDALATFENYAQLYLAHDMTAVLAQTKAMTPAAALINGYGKRVCGYDPQVTSG